MQILRVLLHKEGNIILYNYFFDFKIFLNKYHFFQFFAQGKNF